jgi:hypothetical protein
MCAVQFVFSDVYDQEWEQPSYVRFISGANSSAIGSIWRPETSRPISTWLRYYFLTFHHVLLSTQFYRKRSWPLPHTRHSCISWTGSEESPPPKLQCTDIHFSKGYKGDVFYTYVFIYLFTIRTFEINRFISLPANILGIGGCFIYLDKYHRRLCIHSRQKIILYMYISVCVCVCLWTYVCRYVCMYVFICACMYASMYMYLILKSFGSIPLCIINITTEMWVIPSKTIEDIIIYLLTAIVSASYMAIIRSYVTSGLEKTTSKNI